MNPSETYRFIAEEKAAEVADRPRKLLEAFAAVLEHSNYGLVLAACTRMSAKCGRCALKRQLYEATQGSQDIQCHRDMYEATDVFSHVSHVAHLEGNAGCGECHPEDAAVMTRDTAKTCISCHGGMLAAGSRVEPPEGRLLGFAPGYEPVPHALCIGCHEEVAREKGIAPKGDDPVVTRCDACHRDALPYSEDARIGS